MKRRNLLAGLVGLPFAAAAIAVAPKAFAASIGDVPIGRDIEWTRDSVVKSDSDRTPLFDMAAWDRCGVNGPLEGYHRHGMVVDGPVYMGVASDGMYGPASIAWMLPLIDGSLSVRSFLVVSKASKQWNDDHIGPLVRSWPKMEKAWVGVRDGFLDPYEDFGYDLRRARVTVGIDDFQLYHLATRLHKEGIPVVFISQHRNAISPVVSDLLRAIADGRIVHERDPALRWMMENAHNLGNNGFLPVKATSVSLYSISAARALVNANAARLSHLNGDIA
ncbi:MAG: hypothetical protein ACYCZ0_05105 [Minisyncoccota bacterium]